MSEIIELFWDCPYCGKKEIPGHLRSCPSCGKDRTVQCYEIKGKGHVTDPAEIARAKAGPDWQCGKCGHFNTAGMTACENCGTPKSEGTVNKKVHYEPGESPIATDTPQQQEASPTRMAWRSDPKQDYASDAPVSSSRNQQIAYPSALKNNIRPVLFSLLGIAVVVFAVWFLFIRKIDVTATVSGFSWTRTVTIEKYAWVADSNLMGYPSGSRNQYNKWEVVGYHQEVSGSHTEYTHTCSSVPDGESCTTTDEGNGYASRSCTTNYTQQCEDVPHAVTDYITVADYGWRYYYEIQRWIPSRTPQTAGTDRNPKWPDITLATSGEPERETGRSEDYMIHYVAITDQKPYSCDVSLAEWSDYDQNGIYTLTLNGIGTILGIEKTGEISKQ